MDNKKIYLDKIVQYMVDDTEIDYNNKSVNLLFLHPPMLLYFFPYPLPSPILEYCKDVYGLNDDETNYVLREYKNIIVDKINNSGSINESVDKISKGEYLDKIVDYLVDDTMVDQKNKVWYPPFPTDHAKPTFNHFYGLIPMTDHLELKFLIGNSYVRNFFNYCKDTYGLTDDEEIRKVWKRYLKVLTPIINGYSIINGIPTMNESVDRKNDYLNKVVEYLIDDTIIDIKGNRMRYPFLPPPEGNDPHSLAFLSTPYPFPFFSKYCKDNYGLTDEEIDYLLEKYIEILKYKIENMGSINESVDRKQDYLDKIVDFLMDDTEVGAGWFNPPYYIGNGRSTAGRTGFKSVYLHTFNLSSNTNYSGLDTQLIYFDHYCKNNYGLTGQENKIVWERYMTKLYESYDWGF